MVKITFDRRRALKGGAALLAGGVAAPAISRASSRPVLTHGVQSGDVAHDGAVIWARADRPSYMNVQWSTTEDFTDATAVQRLGVTEATDYSGKLVLSGLPSDQDVFYRVTMTDLYDLNGVSAPITGHFRTAPTQKRNVSFVWSGDTAGQGWGIDVDRGGMRTYAAMLKHDPDFFIHSGDTVYADNPMNETVELADGSIWKNLLIEEKTKVAESLAEFRAQWLYNMMDEHVRAMNARVPMMVQWDDHEVVNNWYPGEILDDERYKEKSVDLLSQRAARAFFETNPIRVHPAEPHRVYRKAAYGPLLDVFFIDMRTYRGANSTNDQPEGAAFLGEAQLAWLTRELAASRATWKVIASDMPIGMIVGDGDHFENGANGDDGAPLGREQDIARLLRAIKRNGVKNTVWLTADVHHTAAHHYSPDRAAFQDFEPFWEFVSGPLHAGTFGPSRYDMTFGPEVIFAKHPTEETGQNMPPSMDHQFFGKVEIDAESEVMTVRLMDVNDEELWAIDLEPAAANQPVQP